MKKLLVLLIGILAFSIVFTACGAPAETPTNIESNVEQIAGEIVQEIGSQENVQENNKQQDAGSVVSKETQEEKKPVTPASKDNAKTTVSKVVEKQGDNIDVDIGTDLDPEFTTLLSMQNWLLSKDDGDQFWEDKQVVLSTMLNGNQIVYYRPMIGMGNDSIELDRIKFSGSTLIYYYRFIDTAYNDLQLRVSCYMDDSFKENYLEAVSDLETKVYGYVSAEVNNHQVLYRDNQYGATVFTWYQFGGYIRATLEGENHADKVQEVLPYLNLEKVTLRTDLETQ